MLHKNYIGGRWVESDSDQEPFDSRNPANLEEVIGLFESSSPSDVGAAIEAAESARSTWGAESIDSRVAKLQVWAEKLNAQKDDLAKLITRDNGKKLADAAGEVMGATFFIGCLRKIAQGKDPFSVRHVIDKKKGDFGVVIGVPAGVSGLITPFNFPLWTPIIKMAAALAAGCPIVMKSPTDAPAATHRLVEILDETGEFPAGTVNLLHGNGLGSAFTQKYVDRFARLSFTGSTETGLKIGALAAEKNVRYAAELGGLNEIVLGPDIQESDERFAGFIKVAVDGMLANGGQMCTAVSRIVVPEERYAAVAEAMVERIKKYAIGDGLDEKTRITPLTTRDRLQEIASLAWRAKGQKEGELLIGGSPISPVGNFESGTDLLFTGNAEQGCYMEPTLFGKVDPTSAILGQTEIFGPVAHIVTYPGSQPDRIFEISKTSRFGLHSGLMTGDAKLATRYALEVQAGSIFFNRQIVFADPRLPFGGLKMSGNGEKEVGPDALHFWQDEKAIEFAKDLGIFAEYLPES
ncbi:MAG: aldehyde dehydrogenase family protein [Planctomycetota bacterium]